MTTAQQTATPLSSASYAAAGAFLEALARCDFAGLGRTVADEAAIQALVPRGLREWTGPLGVGEAFAGWFADLDDYELVEAVVGTVGGRLHLRWRARVRGERLGPGWFLVEQDLYADTDGAGRLDHLRLLCSGYCPEPGPHHHNG